MNPGFSEILQASDDDRRDLFLSAARRIGTPPENIEKDFWVCWILDLMFNGLAAGGPRLLFKGGTSLSKAMA
jgi:predicted nucleotidyltransferase component of viral defense system